MKRRFAGLFVDFVVLALGGLSLLAPFIFPWARSAGNQGTTFPIMVSLIIILCLMIIFLEAQSTVLSSKMIAFLGVLIAINAGIRFLENAIPGPAGFSPTFFLIILIGYLFGSRIGFLMGAMTMFVSALVTGGVGPWLPGQMITAGWVGQSAGLLKFFLTKCKGKPLEVISLAIFGAFWGMLYGAIMNLWFWPFLAASPDLIWTQSANLSENLQRYFAYYLATSLVWDITRSVGNVLVILFMAKPVIKVLDRFMQRLVFSYAKVGDQ